MKRLFNRTLTCPQCNTAVQIPFVWMLGIESVFRCKACRCRFKTGYKMGAVLSALGLSLCIATLQLIVYLLSSYSLAVACILFFPLWVFYGFHLRKWYMIRKTKRAVRRAAKEPEEASLEEESPYHAPLERDPEI